MKELELALLYNVAPKKDGGLHMCCDWSRGERSFQFVFFGGKFEGV